MPKGVEQVVINARTAGVSGVFHPLMPKGVEQDSKTVTLLGATRGEGCEAKNNIHIPFTFHQSCKKIE